MYNILLLPVIIVGLSGIIAQTLLIRELLVVLEGNELSLGIIFGNWLFLEAVGSYIIGWWINTKEKKFFYFVVLQMLFLVSFGLSIYLTRIIRGILGWDLGINLGLFEIFLISFIVLLLPSFTHGALYTFSAKVTSVINNCKVVAISRAYVYEVIGTIIGGIVFTFILIKFFDSFQIVLFVGIISILLFIVMSFYDINDKKNVVLTSIVSLIIFFALMFNLSSKLERLSIQKQWRNFNIKHVVNSVYGKIIVVERDNQYTFFINSIPLVTIPSANKVLSQEVVHFAMSLLNAEKTKDVLVLTNGFNGILSELINYKNVFIDYVEIDPQLIKTIKKFADKDTINILNNKKVEFHFTDPRKYVNVSIKKYNLVILGIAEVKDLFLNRLFSIEFFYNLRSKLKENAIVVFTTPGSVVYLSTELAILNKIVLSTVSKVFNNFLVIPGDEYNIVLCSNSTKPLQLSAEQVLASLTNNKITTAKILTQKYINYKLNPLFRQQFFTRINEIQQDKNNLINYDFHPLVVITNIKYWTAKTTNSITYKIIEQIFNKKKLSLIMTILICGVLLFILFYLFYKKDKSAVVYYSIFTTGYIGMFLSLILMLGVQIVSGYLYYLLGILTASFMLGMVIGSFLGAKFVNNLRLLYCEIFILLIVFVIIFFIQIITNVIWLQNIGYFIFLMLGIIAGIPVGMEIPVVSKIFSNRNKVSILAGKIFAVDTLGGWLGSILGGVIIFCVWGAMKSLFFVVVLKIIGIIMILLSWLYGRERI